MQSFKEEREIAAFTQALSNAKHIIVVAGTWLSAASGIPTFRDGGGMWRSLKATSLVTPEAFEENPSLLSADHLGGLNRALAAQPNKAHILLAKLAFPSYRKLVAPAAQSYHLITQNVDGLSPLALRTVKDQLADNSNNPGPDPRSVIEMHGRLLELQCTESDHSAEDRSSPLCPALGAVDEELTNVVEAGSKSNDIPVKDLPRCPACGALARPGVVWFGEVPHALEEIDTLVDKADLCLVVGTSSVVTPASTYAYLVKDNGGTVAVFNIAKSGTDDVADFFFQGPCTEKLARVFPELDDAYISGKMCEPA